MGARSNFPRESTFRKWNQFLLISLSVLRVASPMNLFVINPSYSLYTIVSATLEDRLLGHRFPIVTLDFYLPVPPRIHSNIVPRISNVGEGNGMNEQRGVSEGGMVFTARFTLYVYSQFIAAKDWYEFENCVWFPWGINTTILFRYLIAGDALRFWIFALEINEIMRYEVFPIVIDLFCFVRATPLGVPSAAAGNILFSEQCRVQLQYITHPEGWLLFWTYVPALSVAESVIRFGCSFGGANGNASKGNCKNFLHSNFICYVCCSETATLSVKLAYSRLLSNTSFSMPRRSSYILVATSLLFISLHF